jgi:hypothetical protein
MRIAKQASVLSLPKYMCTHAKEHILMPGKQPTFYTLFFHVCDIKKLLTVFAYHNEILIICCTCSVTFTFYLYILVKNPGGPCKEE